MSSSILGLVTERVAKVHKRTVILSLSKDPSVGAQHAVPFHEATWEILRFTQNDKSSV